MPVFSVGELSLAVKRTVEGAFHRVRVRGELSGFKRAASGHLYFTLKDDDAVLDGVCWRGTAGRLSIQPEDGMEVIATGRITTYAGRSKYQIVLENLEMAGEGALLKLLRDRQVRLAEEGLFDAARKQTLPWLPDTIGVVTSPTGAVIRDILHRLNDRFPRHVLLWPVSVQGEGAADQIAAAIRGFDALAVGSGAGDSGASDGETGEVGDGEASEGAVPRPDVIIVARGGGSLEDLWPFNEETVVRAVAECAIPVISAVGHETDTTLIDYAADVRAPTPTAAAEMAVPVRLDLVASVADVSRRMTTGIARLLAENTTRVKGLSRGLPNLRRMVEESAQRLDEWEERLRLSLSAGLAQRTSRVQILGAGLRHPEPVLTRAAETLAATALGMDKAMQRALAHRAAILKQRGDLLESYSYRRTLERGFAMITDQGGSPVRQKSETRPGMRVAIDFHDGRVAATLGTTEATTGSETGAATDGTAKPEPADRAKKKAGQDGRQGTLL